MIEVKDIDILISKFLSGEALPGEAMFLEDWKNESKENKDYYQSFEKLFLPENGEINQQFAWKKLQNKLTNETPIIKLPSFNWLKLAASIVLLIGVTTLITYFISRKTNENFEKVYLSENNTKIFKLNDGTGITLSQYSSISKLPSYGKKNRLVKLKGSAYFSVKHDENKPFIVDIGNLFVKDLGTKFNIRSEKDTIFIRVDEGSVVVYNKEGIKLTLEANESAFYVISLNKIHTTYQESESNTVDMTIKLVFENQKLGEIIATLNKTYHCSISLENSTIADCRVTSQFKDEKLENILNILTETLGMSYDKVQGEYIIKGNACK